MRKTLVLCDALAEGDAAAIELALELGWTLKNTSGALSNLKKAGYVKVVGRLPRKRGRVFLYRLVSRPTMGRRVGWRKSHV